MDVQLFILDDAGQVGYSAPNTVRYSYSLYWAVVTMTTLGYGDITPVTVAEKIVAIFIILIGATLFAYFSESYRLPFSSQLTNLFFSMQWQALQASFMPPTLLLAA